MNFWQWKQKNQLSTNGRTFSFNVGPKSDIFGNVKIIIEIFGQIYVAFFYLILVCKKVYVNWFYVTENQLRHIHCLSIVLIHPLIEIVLRNSSILFNHLSSHFNENVTCKFFRSTNVCIQLIISTLERQDNRGMNLV